MKTPLKNIYCISGLGADERAFSKLKIDGYTLVIIPWLTPEKDETLAHYATRMRENIKDENPILIGLSFGGIVGIEIARQIHVEKIIIISSIRSTAELPRWMKAVAKLRLNKLVPLGYSRITEPIQNRMLGVSNEEERKIAVHYRKTADKKYVAWAVHQAINWKSDELQVKIYHIHGDKDRMFPIKKLRPDYVIKNAGHFMILNRADEVSECINKILAE